MRCPSTGLRSSRLYGPPRPMLETLTICSARAAVLPSRSWFSICGKRRDTSGAHVGGKVACRLAASHGHAVRREVLAKAAAVIEHAVDEDAKPAHRAGRQVVQHEQGPGLLKALRGGSFCPAARIFPIARDCIPQHAGHALLLEDPDGALAQQVRAELTA